MVHIITMFVRDLVISMFLLNMLLHIVTHLKEDLRNMGCYALAVQRVVPKKLHSSEC